MNHRIKKLGLGTVQWGLPYGVANSTGVTKPEVVREILLKASFSGVRCLDTGSLYGDAEMVLGMNSLEEFSVVTKTPHFSTSKITEVEITQLKQAFDNSLSMLSCEKVYGLLVHNAQDIFVPGGKEIVLAMRQFKNEGRVEKIGVSVYDTAQIDEILKVFKPDLIQLPLSVLDQRMLSSGHLEILKNEGVEIHVRSAFLQGLLLMSLDEIPEFFKPIKPLLARWHAAARDQGLTVNQAALIFVRDIPLVDKVVIGVNSLEQFNSCVEDFSTEASFDSVGLGCDNPLYLNPSLWEIQ